VWLRLGLWGRSLLLGRRTRIRLTDRTQELSVRRDDEPEVRLERAPQVLQHELVGRIADGDDQLTAFVAKRERDLAPRGFLGQRLQSLVLGVVGAHLDEREPLLTGEHTAEISFVQPATIDQHLSEALARAHAFLKRLLELMLGQKAGTEDQRAERHVDHRRGRIHVRVGGRHRRGRRRSLLLGCGIGCRRGLRLVGEEAVHWFW
jgi:hypothetical protein